MKFGQFLKGGGSILVKPMPNFQLYETETDTKIQIKNVHYYNTKTKTKRARGEWRQASRDTLTSEVITGPSRLQRVTNMTS